MFILSEASNLFGSGSIYTHDSLLYSVNEVLKKIKRKKRNLSFEIKLHFRFKTRPF